MTLPRSLRILLALLLALGSVYLLALTRNALKEHQYIGRPAAMRDTIAIAAEGKVTAIPDIAVTVVGVMTEAPTVKAAQDENTAKMNAILARLQELGVARADIATAQYDIYPIYDWQDGRRIDRGFQVIQSVRVKIRDTSRAGEVLSAAGELGANQVSGLAFTIDEPEALRQEARLMALEAAKKKAEALARAAGVKLGGVVGFSENVSTPGLPYLRAYADGLGGGEAAPSIESGSQEVIVSVSVSYEILP